MEQLDESVDGSVNNLSTYQRSELEYTSMHSYNMMTHSMNYSLNLSKDSFIEFGTSVRRRDLWTFFKMLFLFLNIDTILGLSLLINKRLGIPNVHVSGLLIVSSQIFGFTAGLWLAPKLGRHTINIMSILLYCVYSGSLLVLDLVSNHRIAYFHRSRGVRLGETGKTHQCWRY